MERSGTERYCPTCGNAFEDGDTSCGNCGRGIVKRNNTENGKLDKQCPYCGAAMGGSDSYCSMCGKEVARQRPVQAPVMNSVKSSPAIRKHEKRCPHCNALVNEANMNCPNCGKNHREPENRSCEIPNQATYYSNGSVVRVTNRVEKEISSKSKG